MRLKFAALRYNTLRSRVFLGLFALLAITLARITSVNAGYGQQSADPPAVSYQQHINAGGFAPPAGKLHNPHPGDAESAKAGAKLFVAMNCDGCHGDSGSGWVGPSLADGRWRYGGQDDAIFTSIFYGRPKGMPAYGGVIGQDGVWMLVNYLKSLPKPDVVPTESWIEDQTPATASEDSDANSKTPDSAASSSPATEGTVSQPKTGQAAEGAKLSQLLSKEGCIACHAIDHKVVGPALRDVAAKYRGQSAAPQHLFESAKNGSVGVWGNIPMPPNSSASEEDLHLIIKRILQLK